MHRDILKSASRIVVQLGVSVLTDGRKRLIRRNWSNWQRGSPLCEKTDKDFMRVTSGAVGAGMAMHGGK